jgi:hypothetical protein
MMETHKEKPAPPPECQIVRREREQLTHPFAGLRPQNTSNRPDWGKFEHAAQQGDTDRFLVQF